MCNDDSVDEHVKELLKYCNNLFSGIEKKLESYHKTLEHEYTGAL